jgi:hypothetical protein
VKKSERYEFAIRAVNARIDALLARQRMLETIKAACAAVEGELPAAKVAAWKRAERIGGELEKLLANLEVAYRAGQICQALARIEKAAGN